MTAGLGLLRLDPRVFWSMTILEFRAALKAVTGELRHADPPTRAELIQLMQAYPDGPPTDE
jgi:uncharacterized phage protein (TIGR02216 family)